MQFAQKSHLLWRFLYNAQTGLIFDVSSHVNFISMPTFSKFRNVITRPVYMACDRTSVDLCNDKGNKPYNLERPYEVVVAATRDMGIGKDGKLPWNLPSDIRFFKELTTTTSVDSNRNAVIMGRKTWESIPQKYRPLPGRLNVVLTRAGKLEAASLDDVLMCNDLSSALKLLAEPSHSESIEKVFVIGGGQILKEALNGRRCEAIHFTDIDANIECDTFIPRIDTSLFSPLFSSRQMVENDTRFSFVTYIRTSNPPVEDSSTSQDGACNIGRETAGIKLLSLSKKHAGFAYVKQIQEGRFSGATDDIGKFIYSSLEEMQAVSDYIMHQGRARLVCISHLASKSDQLNFLESEVQYEKIVAA